MGLDFFQGHGGGGGYGSRVLGQWGMGMEEVVHGD